MKELVVISGKGGTGKTSIVASFAALSGRCVTADCDVDAADLFLVMSPQTEKVERFIGGRKASIRTEDCVGCGACVVRCRFEAITRKDSSFSIDQLACEGCGACVAACPVAAIDFKDTVSGMWFVSRTDCGPLIHARLHPGEGNSGKLVSVIRKQASALCESLGLGLVLVDGSPGTGCPVIASLAGASAALIVTEPTLSGIHDMKRVAALTDSLGVPASVCINKMDINPDLAARIRSYAEDHGIYYAGEIPSDEDVMAAQLQATSVVEYSEGPASQAVRALWENIHKSLEQ